MMAPSTTPADVGRSIGVGPRALAWWSHYHDSPSADAGALAQLRRARSPLDALATRAAVDLARRVGSTARGAPTERTRDALDLARVLAHVSRHVTPHPMRAAGWKTFAGDRKESDAGNERPTLTELRFRRLMQVEDGEEKVAAFKRLIALLDGAINIEDIGRDFFFWNHPDFGTRVRERWAFLYFAAGEAAPTTNEPTFFVAEDE